MGFFEPGAPPDVGDGAKEKRLAASFRKTCARFHIFKGAPRFLDVAAKEDEQERRSCCSRVSSAALELRQTNLGALRRRNFCGARLNSGEIRTSLCPPLSRVAPSRAGSQGKVPVVRGTGSWRPGCEHKYPT